MDSNKQKLKRRPVFADVVVDSQETGPSDTIRNVRSQYMKLLYPNGVTLILPIGIPSVQLMEYINAFRS